MTATVLAIVLLAGLGIGTTGIGGLLVVPALSALSGMPLVQAVPASTLGFLFAGLAATAYLRWRRRASRADGSDSQEAPMPTLRGLQLAALVGAGCGAFSLSWLPGTAMHLALAALALGSGLQALLSRAIPGNAMPEISLARQCAIGLAVGIGSAWSGTGGPILLLPVLMWLRTPTRQAIALAQAVQLPIAVSATAVNLWAGQLDLRLGLLLGALLVVGWAGGIWLASRMATARLRQALGWLLVGVGLWYGLHTLRN